MNAHLGPPGFVIDLPAGVLVYNAVVAHYRMTRCSQLNAARCIYGSGGCGPLNLFGSKADATARNVFGDALRADDIFHRHTLFAFYRWGMSVEAERRSLALLAADRSRDGRRVAIACIHTTRLPLYTPRALKYCSICCSEQLASERIALWQLVHQLPFVWACARHDVQLVFACWRCGTTYDRGRDFRFPGEACRSCGVAQRAPKKIRLSPGARGFLSLCDSAVTPEGLAGARPVEWAQTVDAFVARAGSVEEAQRKLQSAVLRRWQVNRIEDVVNSLGNAVRPDFIEREIRLLAYPGELAGRLIVLDALASALGNRGAQAVTQLRAETPTASEKLHRLEAAAIEAGLPVAVIRLVAAGANNGQIIEQTLVSYAQLRAFFDQLPRDLWEGVIPGDTTAYYGRASLFMRHGRDAERMRERFRERVVRAKESNPGLRRGQAYAICGAAVYWLHEHDRRWLDKALPVAPTRPRRQPRQFADDQARRKAYRKDLLDLLASNPSITRTQAHHRFGFVSWLSHHDWDWYDRRFKSQRATGGHRGRGLPLEERRDLNRNRVLEAVKARPRIGRGELRGTMGGCVAWLLKNDKEWLDEHVPRKR